MQRERIVNLRDEAQVGREVLVQGWVRIFRNDQFIALNDGSCLGNLQLVIDREATEDAVKKRITTGAAIAAKGVIEASQGRGQVTELKVTELEILGDADPESFPIQMKRHTMEFLREKAHLRFRTCTFGAVFRVRHALNFAVHKFFTDEGFFQMHTPIITGSDAEGAGEMFQVTTLDLNNVPKADDGSVDFAEDFFGKTANLTVSGQLEAELGAMALGQVYTFGPTFRAENSNTSRHLAEFWMIEPELAFADLADDMQCAEDYVRHCCKHLLKTCRKDLEFFQKMYDKNCLERVENVANNPFGRVSYTEAIEILKDAVETKKKEFVYPVEWGIDLATEHERYLAEEVYKKPVVVYNYPKDIKAFYMRLNPDGKTVAAMDILVPKVGELVGGSQREERLDVLEQRMKDCGLELEEYSWYLDLRRFGSVTHSGFGLGFERLILFTTGMENIRDVIPFPRWPKNCLEGH